MTKNDIAKLCFKLLAVYFIGQLFYQFENIGTYLLYNQEMQEHEKYSYVMAILPSILFVFFGLILWFAAPSLANSIFKKELSEDGEKGSIENFHSVAFSVAGLFLFSTSISEIVEYIVYWLHFVSAPGNPTLTPSIIIAILKILLGVWLIVGSKSIVRTIRSYRRK